jgi:hypothetical protein
LDTGLLEVDLAATMRYPIETAEQPDDAAAPGGVSAGVRA